MAKKTKQYDNAMDSVFDFIFSESKKTPAKVKPIKVTGLDSTDPYVAAAAAALENPLLFVNNTTVDAIKDVGNIEIHKFDIDSKGEGGSAKFSLSNIGDVLDNNFKFVDKAFDRMEGARKAGRMTAWGKTIAAFTAGSMATEMGLDAETRDVLLKVGREGKEAEVGEDKTTGQKYVGWGDGKDEVADYELSRRGVELAKSLMGRSSFPSISESDIETWYSSFMDGASARDKASQIHRNLQDIRSKYTAEMGKPVSDRDFSQVFDSAGNRDMHLFFESINLDVKASEARLKATTFDPNSRKAGRLNQQAQGYEDMKSVLFVLNDSDKYKDVKHGQEGVVTRYVRDKQVELKNLKDELSNSSAPPTPQRTAEIEREIRSINAQVRSFNLQKGAYSLGALETQLDSIKQIWQYSVGGALVPAIINGDFYDARKNSLSWSQPRSGRKYSLAVLDKDGNYVMYRDRDGNDQILKRTYEGLANRYGGDKEFMGKLMNPYYEKMMDLYYRFTPKGIIENLTTGNGVARQAFKQRMRIIEDFRNSSFGRLFSDEEIKKLGDIFGSDSLDNLRAVLGDDKYDKFMDYFAANRDKFERFNRLVNRADSLNIMTRIKGRIAEAALYKKTIGRATAVVSEGLKKILLKLAKDGPARAKIEELFLNKAGLKGISTAIKTALKSYLAGASAGLGAFASFLVDAAVDLGMMVVEKLARPAIKFLISAGVFALVGIFGLLILVIGAPFRTMKTQGTYSHVAPYEIVLGDTDYTVPQGGSGDPGQPGEWSGGAPLPDGVSCLLGEGAFRCSQGPYGSFSHGALNAIDVAYSGIFYAPTFCGKGNCVIEYYGDFSCTSIGAGNAITLRAQYKGNTYRFIMYHVTLSSALSMGSRVSAGEAVGQILINGVVSNCWTGPHLHLEIEYNGSRVNPFDVLTDAPTNGGFGCSILPCP